MESNGILKGRKAVRGDTEEMHRSERGKIKKVKIFRVFDDSESR